MGKMKNYRQLIKELPSKKVVFAFGRFQPPTTGHELLVKAVQKIASAQKADHIIYASRTEDKKQNPLPVSRKVYYLQRMFPGVNFRAANEQVRTFIEAAKELNKKYKNIVMVAGSDRVAEYKKILEKYNGTEFNFDTVTVVSAGERDPDSDNATGMSGTKMREAAKAGKFSEFKKGVPHTLTDVDARRLMNEIRKAYDLTPIKESLNIKVDELREKYFRGEIFNVGDVVVCENKQYTVVKRGSNHLLLAEQGTDIKVTRWIKDVMLVEDFENPEAHDQISWQGYTTKNFDQCPGAVDAFNSLVHKGIGNHMDLMNAIMSTDEYLGHEKAAKAIGYATPESLHHFNMHVEKAKDSLENIGDLMHHDYISGHQETMAGLASDYKETGKEDMQEALSNKTLKPSSADQIKAARIIATTLGVDNVEATTNPEQIVNMGLRKIKNKALNAESYAILQRMLKMASDIGIEYDTNLLPSKLKEAYYDKLLSYDAEGKMTEVDIDKDGIPDWLERNMTKIGGSLTDQPENDNLRKQKVRYHLGEASGDPKKLAREVAKAALAAKHAREKETLATKHTAEKERIAEEEIFEAIDKEHPIAKEYDSLKKNHDIKSLRGLIKTQHKIIDTSEFRTKEHAISHYLRSKHGDKKVAAVFGLKEEQLDEISSKLAGNYYGAATKKHIDKVGVKPNMYGRIEKDMGKQRKAGVDRAMDRITGARKTNEEYEQIVQALEEAISTIDKGEYDYEGAMARTQLQTTIRNSQELINMLTMDENMPEWVQSKITLAQDYISSVRDYLKSREELGESALNPKDPHGDYQAKRKALHDLSLNKDVDQKHVQQRRLDLDKEYSKHQKEDYVQAADTKIGKDGKKHAARLIKIGSDSPKHGVQAGNDRFSEEAEEDFTEQDIDDIVNQHNDWEDIIDGYDDEELAIVDDETGEELEGDLKEETLNEVLSRLERIKAKTRFARTKSKRMVKAKIALKRSSPQSVINTRARRLAIKSIKMRLAKKPLSSLSVAEKERLEQRVSKMKPILNRIAMKLAPRVRQIEKQRLSHSTYTK
jgi:phosphopantetheine adenylyltransferase